MSKTLLEDKLTVMSEIKFEGVGIVHVDLDRIEEINPVILDICRNIKDVETPEIKETKKCFHEGCNDYPTHYVGATHLAKAFHLRFNKALYCQRHADEMIKSINKVWGDQILFKYVDGKCLRIDIVADEKEANA